MKIKHLFLALVIGTLAFASCKKQETPSANNDRTPLAMRTASGDIVSLVDSEKLTAQLQASQASKGDADRYVVESVQVVDRTDEEPYYFIINLIDVEEEKTISCAYIGDFVEEEQNIFYATQGFEEGNYRITDRDGQQFKFKNHDLTTPNDPAPCYTSGVFISCEGEGCANGTCRPRWFHCPPCTESPSNQNGEPSCTFSGLGWGSTLGLSIIVPIIINLFK